MCPPLRYLTSQPGQISCRLRTPVRGTYASSLAWTTTMRLVSTGTAAERETQGHLHSQHSFTFVQNTCKSFLPEEGGRHSRNSELLNMTEDQLGPLQSVKGQVEDDLCLLSPHTFLYKPGRSSSYFPHSVLASQ